MNATAISIAVNGISATSSMWIPRASTTATKAIAVSSSTAG